jgi:hypothetical protein
MPIQTFHPPLTAIQMIAIGPRPAPTTLALVGHEPSHCDASAPRADPILDLELTGADESDCAGNECLAARPTASLPAQRSCSREPYTPPHSKGVHANRPHWAIRAVFMRTKDVARVVAFRADRRGTAQFYARPAPCAQVDVTARRATTVDGRCDS